MEGRYSSAQRGARKVKEHRKITLLPTAYKIFTMAERLRKEVRERVMIPESQANFRKRRGVMENICTLNYAVEKQLEKKKKVVTTFIDLKAAFDSVDREILRSLMKVGRGKVEGEDYGDLKGNEDGRKIRKGILDGERSETGMSIESNTI